MSYVWIGLIVIVSVVIQVSESKRNVLLVIFDDLRPAISGYGDQWAKTPNIDEFMSRSFYFEKAYAQQALCAPSRNSMLTSRRPDTIRLYDFYNYWRDSVGNFTTLPQYFKDNGYETHSVGKVFHPGRSSNYTDDFPYSWSGEPFHPYTERFMNAAVCDDGSGVLKANLMCPVRLYLQPGKTLPDIESMEEARNFIVNRGNSTKPFFLSVGFHKPHVPFKFPKKYLRYFPSEEFNYNDITYKPYGMPSVAWNPYTDIRRRDDFKDLNISFPFGPIPRDKRITIRQGYYAALSYVDDLFGRLMATVNMKNTIVVVTSDHGWSLGEHAEWAKYSNFEVALRVPLIIYTPDMKVSQAEPIQSIVELVDLFPTIVNLANITNVRECVSPNKEILCTEGRSLLKLMKIRKSVEYKHAFSQYPRPRKYPTMTPNSDKPKLKQIRIMGYSVRTANFRYTLWIAFHPRTFKKDWDKIYGEELYDHRIDPNENMNLSDRKELDDIRLKLRDILKEKFSK